MPRRAIIIMLVVLIVGIIGGTAALLFSRFQTAPQATPTPTLGNGKCDATDPTLDADNDGLSNGDEKLWGSDPCNPDTDGDGFKDGDEVKNGHNPTIAAPNDVLPAGFVPGRGVVDTHSTTVATTPTPTPDIRNLTGVYNEQLAANNPTTASMTQFAATQSVDTTLPDVPTSNFKIAADNNSQLLTTYLQRAKPYVVFFDSSDLSIAENSLVANNDPAPAQRIIEDLRVAPAQFSGLAVPPAAASFHQFLLGYTQHVADTLTDGVKWVKTDPVRTMVAVNQLEATKVAHYPSLVQEFSQLNQLISTPIE